MIRGSLKAAEFTGPIDVRPLRSCMALLKSRSPAKLPTWSSNTMARRYQRRECLYFHVAGPSPCVNMAAPRDVAHQSAEPQNRPRPPTTIIAGFTLTKISVSYAGSVASTPIIRLRSLQDRSVKQARAQ